MATHPTRATGSGDDSPKLWDVLLEMNERWYKTVDGVKAAFTKLRSHHTLALWAQLLFTASRERLAVLIPDEHIREELNTMARLGEPQPEPEPELQGGCLRVRIRLSPGATLPTASYAGGAQAVQSSVRKPVGPPIPLGCVLYGTVTDRPH